VQTELAAYVQHDLHWDKAYCMLYLTHGSWVVLWPAQLLILRIQKREMPWATFWRRHVWLVRSTAQMVEYQTLDVPRHVAVRSPMRYMVRTTAFVTTSLTVAGLSWYIAVNKTTPSDLTAIYNCSAFFAYAFSVPLLKERLRLDKSLAVAVAIVGVLVVAYGDSKSTTSPEPPTPGAPEGTPTGFGNMVLARQDDGPDGATRFFGNVIIGIGSVLYGLYEVLYKRFACPPDGTSPGRGMIFANTFGSLIGAFTLLVLWIPLPILHVLGIETFELPTGRTAWLLFVSVVMNATFAGSFLVLISLTSPVLSSVAALLTIFLVAIVDWMVTGEPISAAALVGGCMIIVAFLMLSWSTWREMTEEKSEPVDLDDDDSDETDTPVYDEEGV
jgi:drug/metabolite transporter (DMT)-like permease